MPINYLYRKVRIVELCFKTAGNLSYSNMWVSAFDMDLNTGNFN